MAATEAGMTSALVHASVRENARYDVAWTIGSIQGLIVCAVLLFVAPLVARLFGEERAAPGAPHGTKFACKPTNGGSLLRRYLGPNLPRNGAAAHLMYTKPRRLAEV